MGEMRSVYRVLVEKSEGKRPLERPRRSWEDNINMDLQEMGCGGKRKADNLTTILGHCHVTWEP